jgi:hypothetical protein
MTLTSWQCAPAARREFARDAIYSGDHCFAAEASGIAEYDYFRRARPSVVGVLSSSPSAMSSPTVKLSESIWKFKSVAGQW